MSLDINKILRNGLLTVRYDETNIDFVIRIQKNDLADRAFCAKGIISMSNLIFVILFSYT